MLLSNYETTLDIEIRTFFLQTSVSQVVGLGWLSVRDSEIGTCVSG